MKKRTDLSKSNLFKDNNLNNKIKIKTKKMKTTKQ